MIAKMSKGTGFRGALEYDLRQGKGFVLGTNMAGSNARSLAKEFGEVRSLKPNLTRAVAHVSISLAHGESLTNEKWQEVADKYLEHMGFANNQYVATRHTDTKHEHMHLLINRVAMDGSVTSDSHDYKRQEILMRRLEQEYGLTATISSEQATKKALTKGEVEESVRTGKPSVRMQLQSLVQAALNQTKNFIQFSKLLAEQGVQIKLNQAKTGHVSGISFAKDGVAFTGRNLGKAFTWNGLQKQGLIYEQIRSSAEQ